MKRIYMLGLVSLIVIMMAGLVSATTCTVEDLDYYGNGKQIFTVTLTNYDSSNTSLQKANISISGCGTLNIENATASDNTNNTNLIWNFSINKSDIVNLRDDTLCTLTTKVYNLTAGAHVESSGGISCASETWYPDTSVPSFRGDISPADSSENSSGDVTFKLNCGNTSSATLFIEGKSQGAMTESSDVCSLDITDLTNGFQSWYVVASDGLNSTQSSTYQVQINKPGGMILDQNGQLVTPGTPASTVPGGILNGLGNMLRQLATIPQKIIDAILGIFN